jgi:multidrug transporter EmrE-like cation transporter
LGFVFSVLTGMIILREHVSPIHWVGLALIMRAAIV